MKDWEWDKDGHDWREPRAFPHVWSVVGLIMIVALFCALAYAFHVVASAEGRVPIHRSAAVHRTFLRQTGYPHGRAGYVVDHIVPLACGGADATWNLQWQTIAEAKAKDRIERNGCSRKP